MRTHRLARLSCAVLCLSLALPAVAQTCDLDSPALPSTLVDTGYNQSAVKDGNGGWYTTADPVTGKFPFLEAGTYSAGQGFRVKGLVGNYQGTSGTNYRDLDFIRFKVTAPCYVTVNYSVGRDLGGFTVPFDAGEVSDLSVYTGNVETAATATLVYSRTDNDGCPHQASYRYADGHTQSRIPVAAGDVLVIATTASNATGSTTYNGPLVYAVDVQLLALDTASCGTATNDCIAVSATGGCKDAACCDVVCALNAACCSVAWDASCVQAGVSECGNFVYACSNPGPANDCATSPEIIDTEATPFSVYVDNTNANTDGPNNVNTLCSAMTAKDVWYQLGPMPEDADITISMCGYGNVGDSVITCYNLGAVTGLADGQTLPTLYRGCRDDYCDDNADGTIDAGGPAAYTMVNVVQGNSYLVRVGSYLANGQDPASAPAIQAEVNFNVRHTLWNSGRQKQVVRTADNTTTNLPLATGYRSSTQPDYMVATPIEITKASRVDGLEFCASTALQTGTTAIADRVQWVIFRRDTSSSAWMGTWNAAVNTVVAQGELVFDSTQYANISSDAGKRYFFDLAAPFDLEAGSYFVGLKGTKSGSTTGGLGFYVYGVDGIEHTNPANGRPCYWKCDNFAGAQGTWALITAGSSPTYRVQTGDRANVLYHVPVKLKGRYSACFGDIDGSGAVDNGDVAFALLDYGPCPGCPSDLDGSGEVDFGDVALILLSVGPCF